MPILCYLLHGRIAVLPKLVQYLHGIVIAARFCGVNQLLLHPNILNSSKKHKSSYWPRGAVLVWLPAGQPFVGLDHRQGTATASSRIKGTGLYIHLGLPGGLKTAVPPAALVRQLQTTSVALQRAAVGISASLLPPPLAAGQRFCPTALAPAAASLCLKPV